MEAWRKENDAGRKTKVVIAVDKEVAPYLGDGKKYYGFVSQEEREDELVLTFITPSSMEALARWYMMFSDHARIISPESFRDKVLAFAEKTLAKNMRIYSSSSQ